MDNERQLKIREGVVRRLTKELEMYKEEVEQGVAARDKVVDGDENAEWKRTNQVCISVYKTFYAYKTDKINPRIK